MSLLLILTCVVTNLLVIMYAEFSELKLRVGGTFLLVSVIVGITHTTQTLSYMKILFYQCEKKNSLVYSWYKFISQEMYVIPDIPFKIGLWSGTE